MIRLCLLLQRPVLHARRLQETGGGHETGTGESTVASEAGRGSGAGGGRLGGSL